ncbi:MAG: ABC transporter permease [Bacteroidota bacterium]
MNSIFEGWQEITETIRRHKLRTFLTGLGIWWGVFMLVMLMGSGKGLKNGVFSQIGDQAVNSIYIWGQRTSLPYAGFQPGRSVNLNTDDVQAIRSGFSKEVEYLAPRLYIGSESFTVGQLQADYEVRGEFPDMIKIEPMKVKEGRFINASDLDNRRKIVVIGKEVAKLLFPDQKSIGEYLEIRGSKYQIVGVVESSSKGGKRQEDEESIMMPLTTAQQVISAPNTVHYMVATVNKGISSLELEERLKLLLKNRHDVDPEDVEGVGSFNLEEEFKKISGLFLGIEVLIWIVGIGSLIAGVVGVGNIMLISVKERTQEIGLRKALGATPRSIASSFIIETILITLIAGYLGLVSSIGVVYLINLAVQGSDSDFFATPEVELYVGLGAIFILVLCSVVVGLIPAMKAARMNPVEALRDE